MASKRSTFGRHKVLATNSRREFLQYGGALVGATILAPPWSRVAFAQTVATFDYYISPTGSDGNAGTQSSPWALTAINTKRSVYAGKRVGVLPGTYECLKILGVSTYPGDYSSPAFTIQGGTANSPTVIQSTTPRGAVLDGQGTVSTNPGSQPLLGSINGSNSSYITIDGFEIINAYYHPIAIGSATGGYFVVSNKSPGVVVQNNYIHTFTNVPGGQNPTAITLYACQGPLVQNNYITGISDSSGRATAIEAWNTAGGIIQFNTIIASSNQQVGGIFIKNEGNSNNTIRFNYVDLTKSGGAASGSGGICWDDDGGASSTDYVYNNIVISDNPVFSYAIAVGGWPATLNKQMIYNNTFVGVPGSGNVFVVRYGAKGTISFYNNILYATSTGFRGLWNTSVSALALCDYNCYDVVVLGLTSDGSNNSPTTYSSLGAWQSALPSATVGRDSHTVVGSPPGFSGSGTLAQQYQLAGNSPCKGKGSTTGTASGSATDMGGWGNGATQIGCNFTPGSSSTSTATPDAPVLTVS